MDFYDERQTIIKEVKPQRIWEIDFLRGFCILFMLWDHLMFCLSTEYFGYEWFRVTESEFLMSIINGADIYLESAIRVMFHPFFVVMFFLLCGISCSFSRSNLKRGLQLFVISWVVTIVTTLINMPIKFGVLHMLSCAILVYWLINTLCKKDKIKTAVTCLTVGLFIIILGEWFLHFNGMYDGFYQNDNLAFLSKSFATRYYVSYDYFPLLPNVGYVLIGGASATLLYNKKRSLLPILDKYGWYKPIAWWGKIALWVYLLHQVIFSAIFAIISFLFITPGNFIVF
ncbi:MAG: heparan-alpha-glucosaminide N-acetyltransferase domain-containing protein [Clostridia bacterium]